MVPYKLCQTLPKSQKHFKMNWCKRHALAWALHVICFVTFKAEDKSLNVRETFRIPCSSVCREHLTFTVVFAGGILVSWMLTGSHKYLWPVLAEHKVYMSNFRFQQSLKHNWAISFKHKLPGGILVSSFCNIKIWRCTFTV